MADGHHIENGYIAISQLGIIRFQWNLVCRRSCDKVSKFCKRQMAAILKIVFGYISMIYCPINVKFDMKKQNHTQTHRSHDQNTKFQ